MNKKALLNTLADYFIKKGKVLTKREYIHEKDVPIRHAIVTRAITSWARLETMIRRNCPEKYEQIINPVVKEVPKVPSQLLTKGTKNEI